MPQRREVVSLLNKFNIGYYNVKEGEEVRMHDKIYSGLKKSMTRIHRSITPEYRKKLKRDLLNITKNAAQLYELAIRDIKTGLYNARFFKTVFRIEVEQTKRSGTGLCLLVIDVDNFKEINNRLGHLKGDEILAKLAKILSETTRKADIIARFGGEEFVVLCKVDKKKAVKIAERIRKAVMQIGITVSIGLASFEDDTAYSLFKKADKALYKAKKQGKNCCVVHS